MTKDVLVSLRGLQYEMGVDNQDIETITSAEYYHSEGNHYVVYDEVTVDSPDPIKNMIKFRDDYLEVTKQGAVNINMIFEEKKKNLTNYETPYGEIIVGVDTGKVKITEEDKRISLQVDYRLDVNHMHMADCRINVDIRNRENGLSLR
ncbi:MAG: DUF1934 domain-containing protein [Lachnospiraceae bacterium]|jgi:uncharacterized beta-barrel protein YwiB (DUF1934 family)|nr:DUF1934 domain-containing protein [Lachnospiraceae bacterium]